MTKSRSIDDLKSAHFHFFKTIQAPLTDMEQYFKDQILSLDRLYVSIVSISKDRTHVGVKRTTSVAASNDWIARADTLLSRIKHYLRAMTTPENVREYFPDAGGAASRKIDRLHAIAKVLTVSEHFAGAHLGSFKAELEAMQAEGEAIFGASSLSITEQKTEVEKLREMKDAWENQYQKIKYLLRGYFHGTSTDFAMFFDEKRSQRNGSDAGETDAALAAKPTVTAS
jgi:hypothetical protein